MTIKSFAFFLSLVALVVSCRSSSSSSVNEAVLYANDPSIIYWVRIEYKNNMGVTEEDRRNEIDSTLPFESIGEPVALRRAKKFNGVQSFDPANPGEPLYTVEYITYFRGIVEYIVKSSYLDTSDKQRILKEFDKLYMPKFIRLVDAVVGDRANKKNEHPIENYNLGTNESRRKFVENGFRPFLSQVGNFLKNSDCPLYAKFHYAVSFVSEAKGGDYIDEGMELYDLYLYPFRLKMGEAEWKTFTEFKHPVDEDIKKKD